MAEAERGAFAQVRLDLAIKRPVDLVGREHHHHVGRATASSTSAVSSPAAFGFDRASRPAAQADDDVDAAVVEVERLRAALVAVAEDGDALAGERRGIDVGVADQVHGAPSLAASAVEQRPALRRAGPRPAPPKRGQSAGGWCANQVYWRLA